MAKQRISKTVFDKENFDKVIDRSFKEYLQPAAEEDEMSVEEFFVEYDRLFYDIPPEGEVDSHRFLITRSSQLVDFEKDTEDIQPLLDEIAQLRNQNLEQAGQIIELQTQIAAQGGE